MVALVYYAGRRNCPKDQHLSWPCSCTRSAPVLAPAEEPLRVAYTLVSGEFKGLDVCERHAADRHEWLNIDPGSDLGKRLAVPGITLVQIGSPRVQLQYGEHWTEKFRRVVRSQVDVVNRICFVRSACRNLVLPIEIDPEQHCISTVCGRSSYDHRASWCQEIQPGRCDCGACYPPPLPDNPNQHCTAPGCEFDLSHTAAWCGTPQPRRCGCAYCYPEEG